MIFVLLSFGGWNEAAYISAEILEIKRNMVRALLWSLGIIVAIHLLVSYAYVRGLGLAGDESVRRRGSGSDAPDLR